MSDSDTIADLERWVLRENPSLRGIRMVVIGCVRMDPMDYLVVVGREDRRLKIEWVDGDGVRHEAKVDWSVWKMEEGTWHSFVSGLKDAIRAAMSAQKQLEDAKV